MVRSSGLLPARVLFLGFDSRERGRVASSLAPFGYVCVGGCFDEAFEPSGEPRFDAVILDARSRPRESLRLVDQLRAEAPSRAMVVVASPTDPSIYRHAARLRRTIVLYAPLSMPHLQEALDRLTEDADRPRVDDGPRHVRPSA